MKPLPLVRLRALPLGILVGGKTSRDFAAAKTIWSFFAAHGRN